jgi:hypothetical protein|tara:strand:- start:754 stop:969 length:216 start_codon:yes stop_codon:yes gene_type:complete
MFKLLSKLPRAVEQAKLSIKNMSSEVPNEGAEIFVTIPRWVVVELLEVAEQYQLLYSIVIKAIKKEEKNDE